MQSTKPKNNKNDKVEQTESEESDSNAGSSAEGTEEEISSDEKEEEETEASDTQRDQTANKSDEELSEEVKSRSNSDVKSFVSREDEEENEEEVEASESVISGGEDKDMTQEVTSERPTMDKTSRQRSKTPRSSKPGKDLKIKMFKKTKADKQAEKVEKKRAKAKKKRLEKESKQKAREEKKNKKKPLKEDKPTSVTTRIQTPTGISISKINKRKGEIQSAMQTKNINEKDALVEADTSDHNDEEHEEEESTLTKAIKDQNRTVLLKAKGKDFKAILDSEKHQDTGSDTRGRPQGSLLRKVKMASLRHRAKNILPSEDQETSDGESFEGGSNKLKERFIAQRKGMSTLRRVSGWIQKNVPQGLNLRKKISAWTKAIEISHWLSFRGMKQRQGPKKSRGNIVKQRIAVRVTSKNSLASKKSVSSSEVKMAKEKTCQKGKAGEIGEGEVPAGEIDTEARYAVVFPRMNKLGKEKTAKVPQATPGPFSLSSSTGSPGVPSEPKPPKPGARLVLPVKPELSLLKSIKKPLPGRLLSGGDVAEGNPGSNCNLEGSSNRRAAPEYQDGVSVLQAARRKLDPSQISFTKMTLSGGKIGSTQAMEPDQERDAAVGIPRSTSQPFPNGESVSKMSGARTFYEEEADKEVAKLMGIARPEVHWAGNPLMSGDPQVRVLIFGI